ncbi:aldo/keto reductase family protein [Photorhabdus temperata]|uniref:Aldo/keto reductase, diketogulonate reductase n=1 Tax=Photorhabdus temperata subsp. temperata Meg1 TaxID=1393735 RepID=A0A081RZJ8_PHOTE|nr:aldo/keto reductase [Photorhabdus temperata]KER04101.1 aldo/keto reductase, diketogulonate reductase [Photorhabdus temperata subsp. temperata Meg1]
MKNIGFGTWKLNGPLLQELVEFAISLGYKYFDTADAYKNSEYLGHAIRNSSGESIHITSKIEPFKLISDDFCIDETLKALGVNQIDSFLLHYYDDNVCMESCYKILENLVDEGSIKSWGVSNFNSKYILDCLNNGFRPKTNQVEFHPLLTQIELRSLCAKKNIDITAHRPFGRGALLQNEKIIEISNRYSITPSELILSWISSKGIKCYPKSENIEHLKKIFLHQ